MLLSITSDKGRVNKSCSVFDVKNGRPRKVSDISKCAVTKSVHVVIAKPFSGCRSHDVRSKGANGVALLLSNGGRRSGCMDGNLTKCFLLTTPNDVLLIEPADQETLK